MQGLCAACKAKTDLVTYDEQTHRGWCAKCSLVSAPPEVLGVAYAVATVPYRVGDRVECRTGGEVYDGIGTVEQISMSLEHGGTPVYPTFRVSIDQPAAQDSPEEAWYTECCLTRVLDKEPEHVQG